MRASPHPRRQSVACRYQVSLTAGSLLLCSKTPLAVWSWRPIRPSPTSEGCRRSCSRGSSVESRRDRLDLAAQAPTREGYRRSGALASRCGDSRHLGVVALKPDLLDSRQLKGGKAELAMVASGKAGMRRAESAWRRSRTSRKRPSTPLSSNTSRRARRSIPMRTELIDCQRQGSGTWDESPG